MIRPGLRAVACMVLTDRPGGRTRIGGNPVILRLSGDGVEISTIESSPPVSPERPQPDVFPGLGALHVRVVAPASLGDGAG